MLCELAVQNLALIEDVRVEIPAGLCVWTGETGAGKSLLLGALGLLLGARGSSDLIRAGADELRVTGRFLATTAAIRLGAEAVLQMALDGDEIILSRRLGRGGRSQAYVNEQPVTVATLKRLGDLLVDIHGQRESESLLQPTYQLDLLDAFGKLEAPRRRYQQIAQEMRSLRQRQTALFQQREQRLRELALLRFERDELDAASPVPGELITLGHERDRLANARHLQEFASAALAQLHEAEGSVVEQLGHVLKDAAGLETVAPELAEVAQRLASLQSEVADVANTITHHADRWESDPERLEAVEQRLQLLRRLEVKYRKPLDEIVAYRTTLDAEEHRLQREEDDLESVAHSLAAMHADLKAAALDLSRGRAKVARRLAALAQRQLADLGMGEAQLRAELTSTALDDDPARADVPTHGLDTLELTLAANPGEPALPLRKVASGGELSRTMLALKTVLADHDHLATLVFDEIDANVGGRLGDVLGQKLAALGKTHQVICVTHLPQVASYASAHWTIRKSRRGKRTVTCITPLSETDRLEELASMLRGEARGETTRQEAAAMLASARDALSPHAGRGSRKHSA